MTDSIEAQLRAGQASAIENFSSVKPASGAVLPCPQTKWIEIVLQGQDGKAIGGVAYVLKSDAGEEISSKTTAEGPTRLEGLAQAAWQVSFPELDKDAWDVHGAKVAPSAGRAVGESIEVAQGDCVHAIGARRGVLAATILGLDANRKLVDDKRLAGVLQPGDVLALPVREAKAMSVSLQKTNRFERRGVPLLVKMKILREDAAPSKYLLEIDGAAKDGMLAQEDLVEVHVEPGALEGTLRFKGEQQETVRVGHLDPVTTEAGVKSRLIHLAYLLPQSQIDDANIDARRALRAAVRLFQDNNDLEASGEVDSATRDKLLSLHGC